MEWIIHFIAIWVLFSLLGGWQWDEFKKNVWCGVLSIVIHQLIDSDRIEVGLYKINHQVISLWGSSFFFTFGASFVSGMLISMLQPRKNWVRLLHVLLFTSVFCTEEIMLVKTGAVQYINWSFLTGSIPINFMAIATLSWFSIVVLGKGKQ